MAYDSFRVPEVAVRKSIRRAHIVTWLIVLIPILIFLAFQVLGGQTNLVSITTGLGISAVISGLMGWRFSRRISTWRNNMPRYEVRIEPGEYVSTSNPRGKTTVDETILEDVVGLNWLTLKKEEIESIVYFEGQRIIVTGKDKVTMIPLNSNLAPFEELIEALATLSPIERKAGGHFLGLKVIIEYVPLIGLLIAYFTDDTWLRLIGGTLAVIGFGYQLFILYRIKTGVKNTKRMLFKLVFVVWALFLTWSGIQAFWAS